MKCSRCNSTIWLGPIKLKDGALCPKCAKELGFDRDYATYLLLKDVPYSMVKDGRQAYYAAKKKAEEEANNKAKSVWLGLTRTEYSEVRSLNPTDGEVQILDNIRTILDDNSIQLERKANNSLAAALDGKELAVFRFSGKTTWIYFPQLEKFKDRHFIGDPDDVRNFTDQLEESLTHLSTEL